MSLIHGVIPPIITPYDADGRIDAAVYRRLVDWYADTGCDGLWVCGGTGEGVSLRPDERRQMVELTQEYAAGRLRVIFHVGAPTTADAVDAARHCQELGVDAVSSVPPFFYGRSDDEIVQYYRRLAEATDRPLFLYNLPDATGQALSPKVVERITEKVPTLGGIKHSMTDFGPMLEFLRVDPRLAIIIGRGELTLAAMTLGACGVTCASVSMVPEQFVELYRAFRQDDLLEAQKWQQAAGAVKELYREFPVIAATKGVNAQQLQATCGDPREPCAAIGAEQQDAFTRRVEELGLLEATVAPLVAKPR
jgi:N-acetylneuraminate lyase